jgi:hypothetical protein
VFLVSSLFASVLVETRDKANNSRIARRFVLYDNKSEITVSQEAGRQLYISSAVQETGYTWQTKTAGLPKRIIFV